jgi:outer membrane scaffolding protein for murein synthesis (MipA/OmpV family)
MNDGSRWYVTLGICVILPLLASVAVADEFPDSWRFTAGVGGVNAPRYPGSRDQWTRGLPVVSIEYGRFFLGSLPNAGAAAGLGAYIVRNEHWQFGVGFGADTRKPRNAADAPILHGWGDIKSTEHAAIFGSYTLDWLVIRGVASSDIGGKHEGTLASLEMLGRYHPTAALTLSAGPEVIFGDGKYRQTFFGIDAAQSLIAGVPEHTVKSQRVRALHGGETLNILAMSAGGADGAFGAGALVGLTRSGSRPQFAIVTGVSAGALIAPYAFLGPAWDSQLVEIYTTGRAEHLLQPRGLGALFGSVNRGRPLKELVDRYTTDALIQAVAREAAAGRLLLIVTTDVETGEPVVWDLGSIAMNGGANARTLFRDVLVASASVPGKLPPVIIRVHEQNTMTEEAHVDGIVSVPFF